MKIIPQKIDISFSTKLLVSLILSFFLFTSCNDNKVNTMAKYSSAEDGMLLIDGKREFIIGSYHHPKTENPFKELSDNGYNYVRISPNEAELDSASKFNLMTWISTGSIKGSAKSDSTRISKIVNRYKEHPSLLFWEMEDEPAFTWNSAKPRIEPEPLEDTYQLIKKLDPERLVFTNHGPVNLISTLQKYNNSTDLVAVDVYPVIPEGIKPSYALYPDGLQGDLLNPYISQVGEYFDKMKKVVNNSKPVFTVLQGFAWEMLKPKGERDLLMIQYPTYEESRFMAYNAIVHGANGILYWGTNYSPQPSKFINDLNKVTKELASIKDIIASKNVKHTIELTYHELGYSVDAGIEMILKENHNKYYLITTNSDRKPIKVTFGGLSNYTKINVKSENRKIDIIDGKFIDSYKPFGVHIYEIM